MQNFLASQKSLQDINKNIDKKSESVYTKNLIKKLHLKMVLIFCNSKINIKYDII